MSTAALKHYLATLENALKAGNATEHTHRPALKGLLEALDLGITATNEPKRIACGAPDFIITRNDLILGYIEAKDVGVALDQAEKSNQLKRYRTSLDNLILTDYLDFRWYTSNEFRAGARLARWEGGKLKADKTGQAAVLELLADFLNHQPQAINTPHDLARRMARLAHIIRDIIITAFENGQASHLLRNWRKAFAEVLIADLDQPEKTADFADMVAQTLAYGLFTARVMSTTYPPQSPRSQGEASQVLPPSTGGVRGGFSRYEAQSLIPKSNPFLRDFFARITGLDLEDEPFAPFVDDLVNLLAHTDMEAILADFGRRTRQEDPVVHFYETFLAAYDPRLREARGVYYTPEPVVSYIVRSVDHLLKTRFNCPGGLADESLVTVPNYDPSLKVKGTNETRKTIQSHKVLILDPATGTGTFLYAVIDHIRQQFMAQGNAGLWPGYVKNHLLPRLFGFELLMAPYAVAHFKLSLQLLGRDLPDELRQAWTYTPTGDERLGIYLTNTLEEPHEMTGLPLFTQRIADETNAANEVKQLLPVLVVMGNPPYSGHSANQSQWIDDLLKGKLPDGGKTGSYYEVDGKPLGERNTKWLQDDYVKFIRFAQWRIERSGQGILAFISNNSYLDNPTFRGMRQQLMQSFSEIFILNLHGNSKKKETAPDGSSDVNVFDIQQGVGVGIFIKRPGKNGPVKIYYADFWGTREQKYKQLFEEDLGTTKWELLAPQPPFYLLVPQNIDLLGEYEQSWKITEVFPTNSVGIVTARDRLTIHFSSSAVWNTVQDFVTLPGEDAREKYQLGRDARDWKVQLAQEDIKTSGPSQSKVKVISYRPFDKRFTYYTAQTRGFICMPRPEVMHHMLAGENIGIHLCRQIVSETWQHALVTNQITDDCYVSNRTRERGYTLPLYLYPTDDQTKQQSLLDTTPWPPGPQGRVPNLNPAFVEALEQRLGLAFQPHPLPLAIPPPAGGGQGDVAGRGGESSPPLKSGEGLGEGVSTTNYSAGWRTPPDLWEKLKPLARQMRREPTPAENILWQRLRKKQLGVKFRRQHPIDRFIVDFYCGETRLIVEVDGPIHDYTPEADALRQEYLESLGFRVIRFANEAVLNDIETVLEAIEGALAMGPHPPTPSPISGRGGESSPPLQPALSDVEGSGEATEGRGEGVQGVFTPEDIFHYIYAIFHSPTYRQRYAEFLKIDFPRVPLTSDLALFRTLAGLGRELAGLHLLESPVVYQPITNFPAGGSYTVEKGYPKYTPPGEAAPGRVYINKTQYFEGVPPEVWDFYIGGYQVCDKWLKDRRGRQLSYDDLTHYQRIIVALKETIRLMTEIDAAIPEWPVE